MHKWFWLQVPDMDGWMNIGFSLTFRNKFECFIYHILFAMYSLLVHAIFLSATAHIKYFQNRTS